MMANLQNGIYITSTPIGNSKDITIHALEVLQNAKYILCEDTRKTNTLLKIHNISRKGLIIYNEHSSKSETEKFANLAKSESIAIVSDAGTPLICDPGFEIINIARKNGAKIFSIIGACALIGSITFCGKTSQNTLFLGFFHKKIIFNEQYQNAFYLSPHNIKNLLIALKKWEETHTFNLAIARELTKEFQEYLNFSSITEAENHFNHNPPRGEFTCFLNFKERPQNLEIILYKTLKNLPHWQQIPTKSLASFLSQTCLKTFSAKEIYQCLCKCQQKT